MDDKVKDILEKVKQSATTAGELAVSAYEAAGKMAGEMLEITKLNLQIFDLNGDISALHKKIGEMVYQAHVDADTDTSSIEEWIKQIDAKKAAIEELKKRISELKRSQKCPNPECGNWCSKNDSFCPKCGAKM